MVDIRFAKFHDQVFHGGKNFSDKIEVRLHDGLKLQFDETTKRFVITYKGRVGYLPETSAFIWEPAEQLVSVPVVVNEHRTEDKSKRSKAQVSTPMSHVFEGRGNGQTGQK